MDSHGNKTGGRQKGTPNKATAEVRALAGEYGESAIRELAKLSGLMENGDGKAQSETARISALGMVLDRAYGKALPGRLISIELPETGTVEGVTKAVSVIVQAAARGEITPGEASDLCGILEAQRRAIELSDIERRLSAIEAAQGARP